MSAKVPEALINYLAQHTTSDLLSERILRCTCGDLIELSSTQDPLSGIVAHAFQMAWSDLPLAPVESVEEIVAMEPGVVIISELGEALEAYEDNRDQEYYDNLFEYPGKWKIFIPASPTAGEEV